MHVSFSMGTAFAHSISNSQAGQVDSDRPWMFWPQRGQATSKGTSDQSGARFWFVNLGGGASDVVRLVMRRCAPATDSWGACGRRQMEDGRAGDLLAFGAAAAQAMCPCSYGMLR